MSKIVDLFTTGVLLAVKVYQSARAHPSSKRRR